IRKAASLLTVSPDFDLIGAGHLRLNDLAADCCGRFFSAAVVRSIGTVNVVVARDTRLQPEVFGEVPAHPLTEEFFPSVAILGHRRVRIGFGEGRDSHAGLLFSRIDARGRGEKEPAYARSARRQ